MDGKITLPEAYVIFVCDFDSFGDDWYRYTVEVISYVRQLQKSVDDTKNSRQLEERFMMIEELMQEEFQAGKVEGKAEGIAEGEATGITASVLNVLHLRNMVTEPIRQLVENTKDLGLLQKMLETAVVCKNAEEFLLQFQQNSH